MSATASPPPQTTPAAAVAPAAPSLAQRLREVQVGARRDLEVTRHVFRGEVAYVLRDPLTLAHHRVGPSEYAIIVALDETRTLGAIFEELVQRGVVAHDEEENYYRLVYSMHRLGFLALPLNDEKTLFRRAEQQRAAHAKRFRMAFLSLQIPLWNPDRFLQRTLPWVRLAFTPIGVAIWLATVLLGGYVVAANFHDFTAPIVDLLDGRDLPMLWATLIGLKLFHEFGHAYACRGFGGLVPKMGINLMMLTPTAYVDATSSWSFTLRWQRIVVCLAGMIVELFVAALAVFVWAMTPPGALHSLAHGIVVMASAVTLAFNLNPFLRYDGYHALCDVLELPNLRAHAESYTLSLVRRVLLGMPIERAPKQRRLRWLFVFFALGSAGSQLALMTGVCLAIAHKYYALGVLLGVGYLASRIVKLIRSAIGGLVRSATTPALRTRAIAIAVGMLGVVPIALLSLPMPPRVLVTGVTGRLAEATVSASSDGFLEAIVAPAGTHVEAGAPVVRLVDPVADGAVATAQARLVQAQLRERGLAPLDPAAAAAAHEQSLQAQAALDHALRQQQDRLVVAPRTGTLLAVPSSGERGRFVQRGEALGRIVDGELCVRALLSQEEWARCSPSVGDRVEFRSTAQAGRVRHGTIEHIVPMGLHALDPDLAALAEIAGGDIAIDPRTNEASRAHFQLVARLDEDDAAAALGVTGVLRLSAPATPLRHEAWRRLVLFGQRLREGG